MIVITHLGIAKADAGLTTGRIISSCTTGFSFFVECLKADIHSAKPLSSVTLGKGRSVNNLSAKTSLPSALYHALGKEKPS